MVSSCERHPERPTDASNKYDLADDSQLPELMQKLELVKKSYTIFPKYEDCFPGRWNGNLDVEEKHKNIVDKISKWTLNKNNMVCSV